MEDKLDAGLARIVTEHKIDEVCGPNGNLHAFHHILHTFTDEDTSFKKKKLGKIKPLKLGDLRTDVKLGERSLPLDLIAGHLRTADYDVRLFEGLTDINRCRVPGLVTNVIRAFADRKHYDIVLFDCGPYLSPVTVAVLLGVDYIVSPFKPERDCITAARIMPQRLRRWHTEASKGGASRSDTDYEVLKCIKRSHAQPHNKREVPVKLRGFPRFLGAFASVVKGYGLKPSRAHARFIDNVYSAYAGPLVELHEQYCQPSCAERYPEVVRRAAENGDSHWLSPSDFTSLRPAYIMDATTHYQSATMNEAGLPCMGALATARHPRTGVRSEVCLLYTSPSPRDRG